ncbi:protein phosphatase 1 regulatory subunit 26 [Periophthalmus magnuspinnatus]|uniref:protein phosphatase 1 regulatory subunit 26 n=1 Tax=Periophthalmus magnuspinnatus TaxID=409849 RepID=UPI00145BAC6B|nr:protein phosphatase 1 regulatory subunit 26 [Periophthalmus magnuspinnatus]
MYLMNAPPVAVTRPEWRTCGTPGGYSLPLCLNDSDSDLSTRGTPISDKVQMIIESLRSTQSSVEMGDEKEREVLSGQDGHPQVCKAVGSFAGANSKAQSPIVNQLINPTICNDSHDSDSDDSVDRGIEEAILEYLKEKDGPKGKGETCSEDFQTSKIPRSPSPIPGISRLNSESCSFFTSSKDLPKNLMAEKLISPTTYPIKKYIKHKASITEGSFAKQERNKPPSRSDLPIGQTNQPSKYLSDLIKLRANPEEDSDSSSDDGIEEAIQKFQMEKNLQNKTETQNVHTLSDDSDSTSDDGIEEAIRHYQLEQLKKKSILKPLFNKAKKPVSKCTTKGLHGPNTGTTKKNKLKKKRSKMKKEVLSANMPSNTLLDGTKENVHAFKFEDLKGQSIHPKTNTTAELMCAEAILDISKTVMPGAFEQTPGLGNTSSVDACVQSSLPNIKLEDESDNSSIDSEDGIEQEIRRFLEQKAQMQKQTLGSAAAPTPSDENEGETVKTNSAKKPGRLSLTKKRKQKAEKLNFCTMSALSNVKGIMSLADSNDESTPPASPTSKLQRKAQSGDKSSSLDSDEDLDLAIKDLLKTKKKLKKKTRDLKRKPEKCVKKEMQGPLSKKSKPDLPKQSILRQSEKANYELSYSTLPKDNTSEKACNTSQECIVRSESESYKVTDLTFSPLTKPMKDEDSSVDSDDSIELEIRKFLAEKAKVATSEQSKNQTVSTNGISPVCAETKTEDVKQENQRAEIPSKNILLPEQSTENRPLTENTLPKEKVLLLSPQHLALWHTPAGAQSLSPSSPTCSQSLLEPADGAGAAPNAPRTQKMSSGNIQGASSLKEGQPVLNPNLTASQSASIKWRQSLGLPITDTKIRTPFQVSSSKTSETSLTRPYQSVRNFKVENPVWSSTKTITASFPRNNDTGFHTHALSFLSSARQLPGPFTQALAAGRSSQFSIEEETKSMVHISKDKSVYVELETNRTNHVQVRSRDRSEGKECQDLLTANSRERKSAKMEEEEVPVCPNIKEENFIDEADYDLGKKSNQEKKQGLSTLSLSRAIDPGFTFKPCVALTTEERSERFSRRCMDNRYRKGMISWRSGNLQQSVQHVKRKLQFVPVLRKNDATNLQI